MLVSSLRPDMEHFQTATRVQHEQTTPNYAGTKRCWKTAQALHRFPTSTIGHDHRASYFSAPDQGSRQTHVFRVVRSNYVNNRRLQNTSTGLLLCSPTQYSRTHASTGVRYYAQPAKPGQTWDEGSLLFGHGGPLRQKKNVATTEPRHQEYKKATQLD